MSVVYKPSSTGVRISIEFKKKKKTNYAPFFGLRDILSINYIYYNKSLYKYGVIIMNKNKIFRKTLVFALIILFIGTSIIPATTSLKTIKPTNIEKMQTGTSDKSYTPIEKTFNPKAWGYDYQPTGGAIIGPFIIAKINANFLSGSGWASQSESSRFLIFEFGPYGDGYVNLRPLSCWKTPLNFSSDATGIRGDRIMVQVKYFFGTVKYSGDRTIVDGWCIIVQIFLELLLIYWDAELTPNEDSYVNKFYPTQNFGNENTLEVAEANGSDTARSYLKFDITSIPSNTIIHYALISLYYYDWEGTGEPEVGVYQVKDEWNETTINWNNQPDSSSNSEDSFLIPPADPTKISYWDITELAKRWITDNIDNNGVVFKIFDPSQENITRRAFRSKESTVEDEKPKLIITYNNPPYKPARPYGPTNLKIGTEYKYKTITIDPDDDRLFYWFDWGDGTNSGWIGPYPSYPPWDAIASHTWKSEGNYQIKVKAKDTWGIESIWSDPLNVIVSNS